MSITAGDIAAALDVVTQLTAEIDDLSVTDAIALRKEVVALQKAAKLCEELLETRAVNALDGQPIQVGTTVYGASTKGTGKWRPDHVAIRALIRERALKDAINHETGEVEASTAVRVALDLIYAGFVSESKMPTQKFLETLGVTNKHVANYERGRLRLTAMEIGGDVDEEGN